MSGSAPDNGSSPVGLSGWETKSRTARRSSQKLLDAAETLSQAGSAKRATISAGTPVFVPARRKRVTASSKFSSSDVRLSAVTDWTNSLRSAVVDGPWPSCYEAHRSRDVSQRSPQSAQAASGRLKVTYLCAPGLEGLDEDDDGRDVAVLLRVHRAEVERVGVLDQRREGRVHAQVNQAFRVSLDN